MLRPLSVCKLAHMTLVWNSSWTNQMTIFPFVNRINYLKKNRSNWCSWSAILQTPFIYSPFLFSVYSGGFVVNSPLPPKLVGAVFSASTSRWHPLPSPLLDPPFCHRYTLYFQSKGGSSSPCCRCDLSFFYTPTFDWLGKNPGFPPERQTNRLYIPNILLGIKSEHSCCFTASGSYCNLFSIQLPGRSVVVDIFLFS